jgi:hypothetical protein
MDSYVKEINSKMFQNGIIKFKVRYLLDLKSKIDEKLAENNSVGDIQEFNVVMAVR